MRNPLHNKWLMSTGWIVSSGAVITVSAPKTQAQTATLSFNTTTVSAAANQQLQVEISDPGPTQTIGGQMAVQVSAGTITNIDLITATIFASNNTGQQTLFLQDGNQQALREVNVSSGSVPDSGALFATITLNDTGLTPGSTFTLQLTEVAGQSTFLNGSPSSPDPDSPIPMEGTGYSATATTDPSSADPVTIHVAAVPEPASGTLLCAGAAGVLMRRRRKV